MQTQDKELLRDVTIKCPENTPVTINQIHTGMTQASFLTVLGTIMAALFTISSSVMWGENWVAYGVSTVGQLLSCYVAVSNFNKLPKR